TLFPIDTGWFAKDQPFAYLRDDRPVYAAGGDAWLEATPPVLTYFQALPGLMLTLAIGVDRLRDYSLKQQAVLTQALEEHGIATHTPANHGAYVLIGADDGHAATAKLKEHGVNCDARPCPGSGRWVVRLCPDLLNSDDELRRAAERIAKVIPARAR
ncbi:MAG: hypothetical protein WD114_02355, partial [Phycisphaerales bacterium]